MSQGVREPVLFQRKTEDGVIYSGPLIEGMVMLLRDDEKLTLHIEKVTGDDTDANAEHAG